MAQDQLDLTPQDTLALSAAMRRPLTDLFTRIRAIAAHEEMLTPYLRQELEVLLRDGYRLLRLADSLSTVECYELPPNAAVFPLWQQLQECLESTRLLLGANGRTLCYDLPEENDMVRGDAEMLMRAILHLICNGLDAADDATAPVTVRGSVAGDQAILTILDEGRGIPPEQLEEVFTPYRSHDKDGLPYQSPGLGLPPGAGSPWRLPAAYQLRGRYRRGLLAAAVPGAAHPAAQHGSPLLGGYFLSALHHPLRLYHAAMALPPAIEIYQSPGLRDRGSFILSAGRGIQAAGRFGFAETRGLRPRRRLRRRACGPPFPLQI